MEKSTLPGQPDHPSPPAPYLIWRDHMECRIVTRGFPGSRRQCQCDLLNAVPIPTRDATSKKPLVRESPEPRGRATTSMRVLGQIDSRCVHMCNYV